VRISFFTSRQQSTLSNLVKEVIVTITRYAHLSFTAFPKIFFVQLPLHPSFKLAKSFRPQVSVPAFGVLNHSHSISGFLDFFHCLVFLRTRRLGNWICFRPQVKVGEKTPTQLGPLERANLSTSKIVQRASQALLRDRIYFHWRNKASILNTNSVLVDLKGF
jgi:hypothetical protein